MFFKRILYILLFLLLAALIFQITRTFVFTRFIGNTNELVSIEEPVSATVPEDISFGKYLMLYDSLESNSTATHYQIEKVLEYMKVDFDSIDIQKGPDIDFGSYECIIFSFESLSLLGDSLNEYTEYVRQGGNIILAIRPVIDPAFNSISNLLAIDSNNSINDSTIGLKQEKPFMMGMDSWEADTSFIQNSSIDAELDTGKETELYLSAYNGIPLLWETAYGLGKFIIFNGTMLNEKNNRGVLCNLITLSKDIFIYPIANIKMVHIDDFPAPIPQGTDESIMEEFNRDIPQFYREVWW